jgi:hypothetical protein
VRADTNQPSAPLAGELEALARLVHAAGEGDPVRPWPPV